MIKILKKNQMNGQFIQEKEANQIFLGFKVLTILSSISCQ